VLNVFRDVRARVDGDVTAHRIAHEVAVGARAGHEARVGRGEPHHVFQQRHRAFGLPGQFVHDLAARADQSQLAEWRLVLHVARLVAVHQAGARAAGEQGFIVDGAGIEHRLHGRIGLQPL
jgi:hypothetical protein